MMLRLVQKLLSVLIIAELLIPQLFVMSFGSCVFAQVEILTDLLSNSFENYEPTFLNIKQNTFTLTFTNKCRKSCILLLLTIIISNNTSNNKQY